MITYEHKRLAAFAVAIGLLTGGATYAITTSTQEPVVETTTKTLTDTETTTEPQMVTKTETKTHTPPARTVTETQVARSSQRTPAPSASSEAPSSAPAKSSAPSGTSTAPVNNSAPQGGSGGSGKWDKLAQCESGGDWSINTGNGFSGGVQFHPQTWAAYGGTKYAPTAGQATKSQQIEIAEKVLAAQGPGAWPSCSYSAGMR